MSETVTSTDGTTIAYECHGSGPPVVCLHGTGVTRDIWHGLGHVLADETTVVAVDRRGRGGSGDRPEHTFERELEDVRAVVEAINGEPVLFGSSYGGLLAMTAVSELSVSSLAVYEPPMPKLTLDTDERLFPVMKALLDAGNREEAVKHFFREATGAERIEHWPIWPDCIDLAETMVREVNIVESFDLDGLSVSVPTVLFTGERSPTYLQRGIRLLEERIPDSRVVEIERAGHAGVVTAPQQVADGLRTLFDRHDAGDTDCCDSVPPD